MKRTKNGERKKENFLRDVGKVLEDFVAIWLLIIWKVCHSWLENFGQSLKALKCDANNAQ
ncbi:CLUMA_CG005193, isoform A [Clunio marinus]|uniref:CLUMA_CG005193, isoform A n=1 Tax=Clunio marinus TaxID=568069 RepID=A0A1J1HYC3_9DIPT|nr:CLUMA_CG005193, isoform A [Clunio marinus]